ncbi:MAG TPA: hypothetical protein VIR30_02960 [Nocardioides sp.]
MARGPLQQIYLQVHPGATTGLELCAFFEQHPNVPFTHSELKRRVGCSDRIIREHVPEVLNFGATRIAIDTSQRAWIYTYVPGR